MSTKQWEGFTGLCCVGKAPPPKSVEVKNDSGRAENICPTVAIAESYCLDTGGRGFPWIGDSQDTNS